MRKATEQDKSIILDYLAKEEEKCLYMYADIERYGLDKPFLTVWYDEDNLGIRMVVMKYHNSFQVYSSRGFDDLNWVVDLVNAEKPYGISARKEIAQALANRLSGAYSAEYGTISKTGHFDREKLGRILEERNLEDSTETIELAQADDAREIAELLFLDEEMGSIYTVDTMVNELKERIESKMGRSYVIRKNGKIIAHAATYAECSRFAIESGLMVHPDYRGTDYAHWLEMRLSFDFPARYFFTVNKKIMRLHKNINIPLIGEYGKLALIDKEK